MIILIFVTFLQIPAQIQKAMSFKKKLLLFLFFLSVSAFAQERTKLKSGDLIFQRLDCGPLCDAINAVTKGYQDHKFNHMGMVYLRNDTTYIIEALGKDVHLTTLDTFLQRTTNPHYTGRLKKKYKKLIRPALTFCLHQLGIPYDNEYLYDNGKYYCSELIYDGFKYANQNQPFFELFPMTYKQPGSSTYFPEWKAYFDQLGMEVPEGKPGCNPGGISLSDKIEILGVYP